MSVFVEHEGLRYRIRPSKVKPYGYSVCKRVGWRWVIVPYEQLAMVVKVARTAGYIK